MFYKILTFLVLFSTMLVAQQNHLTEKQKAEINLKVEQLNNSIKQQNLKWVARVTSKSYLSKTDKLKLHGDKFGFDRSENEETPPPLNKILSVPDWSSDMSAVEDQECGNCWAHACTGVVEGVLNRAIGSGLKIDLDEYYLTNNNTGSSDCDGGSPYDGFNYIKNYRLRAEQNKNNSPNFDNAYSSIVTYSVDTTPNATEMKNALNNSPLYVSMDVYSDFYEYSSGIYSKTSGATYSASHAVVLVSYNDTEQYWLCKNSWGDDWGIDGFFKIAYGQCNFESKRFSGASINQSSYPKIAPDIFTSLSTMTSYQYATNEKGYIADNYT